MTDTGSAWKDTGERLNALGLKLKMHYEQQRGAEAEQTHEEVADAVRRLTDAVHDAFEALGTAAKDEAVRDDFRQVGQSLADALGATFAEVSAEVRKVVNRPAGSGERRPPPGTP